MQIKPLETILAGRHDIRMDEPIPKKKLLLGGDRRAIDGGLLRHPAGFWQTRLVRPCNFVDIAFLLNKLLENLRHH
jgi:hypothetical protein